MNQQTKTKDATLKVPIKGYVALILGLIFFSGIFAKTDNWLGMFDFTVLVGNFGTIDANGGVTNFIGKGGFSATGGFLFAVGLIPSVMLALGIIEVIEHYGGLKAAQRLMNPILRPLMGIPGKTGLALVSSLQSTDAGASMTKALKDTGDITEKEKTIFAAFQFTAGGTITNYLSVGVSLFAIITVPILLPLMVL